MLCFGVGQNNNFVKMLMLPKLAYSFNVIAVKIPVMIFIVFDTLMLKVMWEKKELGIASVFLKNESWTRKLVLSDMKSYYSLKL